MGGILGSLVGSTLTSTIVGRGWVVTENLLLVGAGVLVSTLPQIRGLQRLARIAAASETAREVRGDGAGDVVDEAAPKGRREDGWVWVRQDPYVAAMAALDRVGLASRADSVASALSHGEQRQLEIAMALATDPRLLMLDEPTAGMGYEETAQMVQLLESLKGETTILLIEHDMDAVFALADRIVVLVYGRVAASGDPEAVRNDPEVRKAYLGEEDGV